MGWSHNAGEMDGRGLLTKNVERSESGVIILMRVMKTLFALHQPWECEIWPGYDPFVAQCLSKFDVAVEPTHQLGPSDQYLWVPTTWGGEGGLCTPGGHIWTSIRTRARPPAPPGARWLVETNLVMVLTPPGVTQPSSDVLDIPGHPDPGLMSEQTLKLCSNGRKICERSRVQQSKLLVNICFIVFKTVTALWKT